MNTVKGVTWRKEGIWEIVERAVSTPRCMCGCGRYSDEKSFASPECFNREEDQIV